MTINSTQNRSNQIEDEELKNSRGISFELQMFESINLCRTAEGEIALEQWVDSEQDFRFVTTSDQWHCTETEVRNSRRPVIDRVI